MNTGQMMLVIAALALLATLAVSVNGALVGNEVSMNESALSLQAVTLASSIITEAGRLAFDEELVGAPPADFRTSPAGLTPGDAASMGPDPLEDGVTLEAYPAGFDDVDDYNGLERSFVTPDGEPLVVRAWVGYVDPAVPAHVAEPLPGVLPAWGTRFSLVPTYTKKMEIRVSSAAMPGEICLDHMFAYHP